MPRSTAAKNAALLALIALDVILVVFLIRHRSAEQAPAAPAPSPTVSTPQPSALTASTAAGALVDPDSVSTMPVEVVDDSHLWAALPGTCAKGGTKLLTTSDGGRTVTATPVPFNVITRVAPSSSTKGFVVGAGKDCTAQARRTADSGKTWASPGPTTGTWYLDPAKPTDVHTVTNRTVRACGDGVDARSLVRVTDAQVVVLCRNGEVRTTNDSGATFTSAGTVKGAVAVTGTSTNGTLTSYVAAVAQPTCTGVSIAEVGSAKPLGCASMSGTFDRSVGLAVKGASGWLFIGQKVAVSTDGLKTWTAPS
ncbi:MAG: hypothetical protein ACK5MP_03190 [Nostocoides sp.]